MSIAVLESVSSTGTTPATASNHTASHDSIKSSHSPSPSSPSSCWSEDATSILFQLAYICLLIAYLAPGGKYCLLLIHIVLAISHVLIIIWVCKTCFTVPSLLGWSITFLCVNVVRIAIQLYTTRHIKFAQELEDIYEELFATVGVSRESFRKLTEQGKLLSLHSGESYAVEKVTATNRLSLLITGKVDVSSRNHYLHSIYPGEFLDSPEWESGIGITVSTATGKARERGTLGNLGPCKRNIHFEDTEENVQHTIQTKFMAIRSPESQQPASSSGSGPDNRFNVSLIAATQCRILCWNRVALEYLLAKDKQIFKVLGLILGRDITNKLYSMNEKLIADKGSTLDIRLPVIITSLSKNLEQSFNKQTSKQEADQKTKVETKPEEQKPQPQTTNQLASIDVNLLDNKNDSSWLPMKPLFIDDDP